MEGCIIDGVDTTYLVDAFGSVHAMEQGSSKLVFFYDSTGRREGFSYYEDDELVGNYYYLYNAQGDVTSILDANLNVVVSYYYDSWGKPTSTTGTLKASLGTLNPFRYRGYIYDEETGFYYLNSRYYDPETGRFINADDVSYLGIGGILSYNLFAYCENDPVNGYDPYGTFDLNELIGKIKNLMKGMGGRLGGGASGSSAGGMVASGGGGSSGVNNSNANVNTLNNLPANKGYSSFKSLKNAIGSAGKGKDWHHIVEQSQIERSGFTAQQIHNTSNMFAVDKSIHTKITGYYNTVRFEWTYGLSVRDWLAGQSFEFQFEFGLKVLRIFGVIE